MTFTDAARRLTSMLARTGMRALLAAPDRIRPGTSGPDHRGTSRRSSSTVRQRPTAQHPPSSGTSQATAPATRPYRGDWTDPLPHAAYSPKPDGRPDPGEIVWAWVPYEEDHRQGKDRPTLIVARHPDLADIVLALPLTSKNHDRDEAQEARAGRHWMDVGSGSWDGRGRPSEVRLDRVLQLDIATIRREGATLDRATFDEVIAAARAF